MIDLKMLLETQTTNHRLSDFVNNPNMWSQVDAKMNQEIAKDRLCSWKQIDSSNFLEKELVETDL